MHIYGALGCLLQHRHHVATSMLKGVSVMILTVQGIFMDITIQNLAAASVLGLLPAILIVVFLQKYIISAMMSGAVKG